MNDEEYFYLMAEKMNKIPTKEQLEAFLKEVNSSIRVRAFILAMEL
jgi:hypothetical protein